IWGKCVFQMIPKCHRHNSLLWSLFCLKPINSDIKQGVECGSRSFPCTLLTSGCVNRYVDVFQSIREIPMEYNMEDIDRKRRRNVMSCSGMLKACSYWILGIKKDVLGRL